jgi:photosystem II stability/assembly factor-like uncharacterized protein
MIWIWVDTEDESLRNPNNLRDRGMEAGRVFGIAFIDRDSGWAVGGPWPAVEGFLFHTTDCGSTWTRRVISYRAAV